MSSLDAKEGDIIYQNRLSSSEDLRGWVMEGKGKVRFPEGRMQLENELDPEHYGDDAHFVYWCPETFPDEIIIKWDFYPVREPGLCMIFFAAAYSRGRFICSAPCEEKGKISGISFRRHQCPASILFQT